MKKVLIFLLACSLFAPQNSFALYKKKKKKTTVQSISQNLNGKWVLTYLEGSDIQKLYQGNTIPTITFDVKNKRISGNNSCNSFSGPVNTDNYRLKFDRPLQSTLKACPGDGEQKFMNALSRVTSYSFPSDTEVDFISGDIGVMRLMRKK